VISRRTFVASLTGGLIAAPLGAGAQRTGRTYRIGAMTVTSPVSPEFQRLWDAFFEGLREFGYIEGKNIALEKRSSEGRSERFPEVAAQLVGMKVDLIMALTTSAALAAKRATTTIPILFVTAIDPVGTGLAASLARPGGNVTGLTTLSPELSAKRLELIKEVVPHLSRVGVLWNAANPANSLVLQQMSDAARRLAVVLQHHEVRGPDDFASRFVAIAQQHPDALVVPSDQLMFRHRQEITQFVLDARLPSIFEPREMVVGGGLLAYGPSYPEIFRRAAFYVDRLLKSVQPADLPFEQPTKFELVINLKTAKAVGLTIPPSLLARADQVIE
jgi:putative ABC transport system substrate-binding protein